MKHRDTSYGKGSGDTTASLFPATWRRSCTGPQVLRSGWEDTLHPWIRELDSTEVNGVRVPGFVQGENEKSVFRHAQQKLVVRCYVDDGCVCGPNAEVLWFLEKLAERFNCKEPIFFSEKAPIDHLGVSYFMHEGLLFYCTGDLYAHAGVTSIMPHILVSCTATDLSDLGSNLGQVDPIFMVV